MKSLFLSIVFLLLSNVVFGQNTSKYKSPINGDTITINGKQYLWKNIEENLESEYWDFMYWHKYTRHAMNKHNGDVRKIVWDLWRGIKSGSITYNGSNFNGDIRYQNASKSKEDYAGMAAAFISETIEKATPVYPRTNYFPFKNESEIRNHIDQNNDGICGIYEPFNFSGATVACVKSNGEYYIIYASNPTNSEENHRLLGDIKAKLRRTASNILMADKWYHSKGTFYDSGVDKRYVVFDGATMIATNRSSELTYIKTYPLNTPSTVSSAGEWTGTGFALRDGYVVTNNHVVKGASSISVVGVNGSSTEMKARVVAVDSKNDLAIIKINDSRFYGFGSIPYSVKNMVADVGADVFVLGYPLTQYMGDEIKLTNGIISSRSGYQGDVTTYQISAPVQPGNSGGPMFDKNGNVIGIINAGIPNAENVGYAIKTSYLFNLINSQVSSSVVPSNNTLAGMTLSDKVKAIRNYVFQIKCH